jgi:hypothetical protein
MKIIQENPYRIVGLLSNASAKDIQGRKGKITAYAKVGKQISSEFDFSCLNAITRDQNNIDRAFSAIQQSKEMLANSLFWFLNTNSFDEAAIAHLEKGDKDKAIEIWEKVTLDKDVTSKNFSCFNNIGTLKLLGPIQTDIKQGIEAKLKLIESSYFMNFVHAVAGEAFIIDSEKQWEIFLDTVLSQFKEKYSSGEVIELFDNCNDKTLKYLANKFADEPFNIIESAIEDAKQKRNISKIDANKFGTQLHNDTKVPLEQLKSLLGIENLKYKLIADNVAKEIMQCGIDYFNESKGKKSKDEYLENAMQLNKIAESIAVGKLTKERAKDHIATLEEMKDEALSDAVIFLRSIKKLYLENEKNIRNEIKKLELSGDILLGIKSINYSAVEDNIKNSIQWQKLNEMIVDLLSDVNLKKIKESNNEEQKKEFLELATWLKAKSLKSATITAIISKYKNIPPKLPFKIISSVVTNTDDKPLYNKFVRFIGLNIVVQAIEEKKVVFYVKYIKPDGSVSQNKDTSPKGYSFSETVQIAPSSSIIKLLGWGSTKESTFSVGKNRIEVYVDEFMIHSKEFNVDLAPSEKLEKELLVAENKLKEIKNTDYLDTEMLKAHKEMRNIKEWQFLRSQSDRDLQISNKQKQIDILVIRAENEKASQLSKQASLITDIKSQIQKAKY